MIEPKIKGGYILLSRRLVESEIFDKPPLYLKVWIYLLSKAQHKDFKGLKRGQLWTNIPEIQEACSWYVGYRKETPTKKQIYTILEWLRNPCEQDNEGTTKGTMIVTTKVTQGLLINVDKYSFYQDSKNYEGNSESNNEGTAKELRREQQGNNINKNDNNDNNITTTEKENKEKENWVLALEYFCQKSSKLDTQLKPRELEAAQKICNEVPSLNTVLRGIDQAFDKFKPDTENDKINSFCYCIGIIKDLWKCENINKKGGKSNVRDSKQPAEFGIDSSGIGFHF
ncbi:hypothetical protein ACJDU8_22990 [Clostridium sp. WILCCON 0269]|uniref:PH domain-containing protein n=1 Tax=Candidatus Clostridium eludens TaxID=3381663 RepID=A0ABW8SRW0_9CLOT